MLRDTDEPSTRGSGRGQKMGIGARCQGQPRVYVRPLSRGRVLVQPRKQARTRPAHETTLRSRGDSCVPSNDIKLSGERSESAVRSPGVFALLAVLVESSHLFLPQGTLPKESRVEVVQVETGWFETREIGAARGFTRLAAKRGEEIAIAVPAALARGRGQLALELLLPKSVKPDPKDIVLLLTGHEKKL